ncbi:Hypothetical predicted protein, partial [Paramuricea clavata]
SFLRKIKKQSYLFNRIIITIIIISTCGFPALAWKDITSNDSVSSEIHCAFNCGNEPTCAGFKYKFGTNSPSVNCQLSNTTGKNNMANYDDQGWVFFIDVTKKLKQYSTKTKKEITTTSGIPTTEKEMTTTPGIPTTVLPQRNECSSYSWLNESNRNQNYSKETQHCDDGLSGWYRFGGGAGIKMASSCVPQRRCGTHAPGWMNGAHPTVADGKVTRKVCYTWINGCCMSVLKLHRGCELWTVLCLQTKPS